MYILIIASYLLICSFQILTLCFGISIFNSIKHIYILFVHSQAILHFFRFFLWFWFASLAQLLMVKGHLLDLGLTFISINFLNSENLLLCAFFQLYHAEGFTSLLSFTISIILLNLILFVSFTVICRFFILLHLMLLGNIVTNVGPRNSLKHLVKKTEGRIFRIHFFFQFLI